MATNARRPTTSANSTYPSSGHIECNHAELKICIGCGDEYCPACGQCACDRLAAGLDGLIKVQKKEIRLSLLQRFIKEWAE